MTRALACVACLLAAHPAPPAQDDFDALMQQARAQLSASDFSAALSTLDSAAALRPRAPEVAYGRGIALVELGRYRPRPRLEKQRGVGHVDRPRSHGVGDAGGNAQLGTERAALPTVELPASLERTARLIGTPRGRRK